MKPSTKKLQRSKIVFVLPALVSGGAERVLITLMNGIDKDKYEPVFLSINNEGELKYLIDETIGFHCLNKKLSLSAMPSIYFKLKDLKPDIVISTMVHMNFAMLALKPLLPKTIFIVREAITPSFLLKKYKSTGFIIKALYKTLYPWAGLILSPSQKIFDEFNSDLNMDGKNFRVIPNPVDEEKIRKNTTLPNITNKEDPTLNFVACGRLHEQKGFDRLIVRLAEINIPYDYRVNIVGEGEDREYLQALIKQHNLQDKVFLLGLIKEPYQYFAQADCFLLPSRFEGLPNVALESLACGTPVIATKESGGIAEIAAEAGSSSVNIVDDMDEFIKAMEKIEPNMKEHFSPSLLPSSYRKDAVVRYFEEIISSI